jgi:hypothetical protein
MTDFLNIIHRLSLITNTTFRRLGSVFVIMWNLLCWAQSTELVLISRQKRRSGQGIQNDLACLTSSSATERRGRVVNTDASYPVSGSSRVRFSDTTNGYPDWGFSWFSSFRVGECRGSILKLGHDSFLSNPFQFNVIRVSFYHWRYV